MMMKSPTCCRKIFHPTIFVLLWAITESFFGGDGSVVVVDAAPMIRRAQQQHPPQQQQQNSDQNNEGSEGEEVSAITLTSGIAIDDLDFSSDQESKLLVLDDIALGDTVSCTTHADAGDLDLYVHFNTPPLVNPNDPGGTFTCDSIEHTSQEFCVVKASEPDHHTAYVLLRAWKKTFNATVTCTKTPAATIVRNVPTAVTIARAHDALFQLDIQAGESVECMASGEADLDLYLSLGAIPRPDDLVYDCTVYYSSASLKTPEHCTLDNTRVPEDTTLYILLDVWSVNDAKAELICNTVKPFQLDREVSGFSIQPTEERSFAVEVQEATTIACWANASFGGDLELSMVLKGSTRAQSSCRGSKTISETSLNQSVVNPIEQDEVCLMDASAGSTLSVQLRNANETGTAAEDVHLICVAVEEILTNGVATSELAPEDPLHTHDFAIPVEEGDWITCSVTGSQTDVSLRMGHNQIPREGRSDCHDTKASAACGYLAEDDGWAFISLHSLSHDDPEPSILQCWTSKGLTSEETAGVVSLLKPNEERLFVFPNVVMGSSVDCMATKTINSQLSLSLRFDTPPSSNDQELNDCYSDEQTYRGPDNNRVCQLVDAPHDGNLYISVQNIGLGETSGIVLGCSYIETPPPPPAAEPLDGDDEGAVVVVLATKTETP